MSAIYTPQEKEKKMWNFPLGYFIPIVKGIYLKQYNSRHIWSEESSLWIPTTAGDVDSHGLPQFSIFYSSERCLSL